MECGHDAMRSKLRLLRDRTSNSIHSYDIEIFASIYEAVFGVSRNNNHGLLEQYQITTTTTTTTKRGSKKMLNIFIACHLFDALY